MPIGGPIDHTTFHLVDERLARVASGEAGELLIGGAGVARGYHGRPDLTAERFIANPFVVDGDPRLYRTGDLVRRRADGRFDFLGRMDHQVKIRGHRVELGEIEHVLARQPDVDAAIVIAREDHPDDVRLVAYIVARRAEDADSAIARWRQALSARLPGYMVPSAFVRLGRLPLNSNGKVDRNALPAPVAESVALAPAATADRTPTEALLAEIWATVLGRGAIGGDDDFFELGGHSLHVTRVASRILGAFGVVVPIEALFSAPRLSELAALVDRQVRVDVAGAIPPLVAAPRPERLPLSYAQERVWFLEQLTPSAAFNLPYAWDVRGDLDVGALRAALNEVVRRHESLRTRFVADEGVPWQEVWPTLQLDLPVELLESDDPDGAARHACEREAARPFDVSAEPLLRARLLRLGPAHHRLLVVFHHLVSDDWSMGVFRTELGTLYGAFAAGRPSPLAALAVQYADFAIWQRGWLSADALEFQVDHWRRHLEGCPTALDLPTDRPRPAVQELRGARVPLLVDPVVAAGIRALTREHNVTLFMVLMAALQATLFRHTGQRDIVVGLPIANRHHAATESLIGFFVNTLSIRARLEGTTTFAELLREVRDESFGAYAHQDVPFARVIERLNPPRDLSRSPIFQVMLALENAADDGGLALPGVETAVRAVGAGISQFDMTLFIGEAGGGLAGHVEFSTALFDTATVERFVEHFVLLLGDAVRDVHAPIDALRLLPDTERALVLDHWNATATPFPPTATLPSLLADQAARTPTRIAVSDERRSLTYAELDAAATALARALRAGGVARGSRVGIAALRSVELVVGLIAVVKAGGAYVPIDPEYPADRIAYMLADADVAVLLASNEIATQLPPHQALIVSLEGVASPTTPVAPADWDGPSPDDPAYLIYTSGSTGRPKGAVNAHRGIVNRLLWIQREYRLTGDDAFLQKTPFSFDVSVGEFFWPLIAGARLVMARPGGHRDPDYLAEVIPRERITVCHFVPTMLRSFLADPGARHCRSLRDVMASGEALPADAVAAFYATLPGARLHNLYGPTECAVEVSYWPCPPSPVPPAVVPIGRPIANTRLYVLDDQVQPCPIGVAGELYLAGVQVGLGYHNRPALTAERFVIDPYAPGPERARGARMYRTGDRARWRADGTVEYLGRLDFQVKVRGFRIELGEIEAAIAALEAVRECVVALDVDAGGDPRLVAYCVPEGESSLTAAELRAQLSRTLPSHMLPSALVLLSALPLSPAGKLDRKALPRPGAIVATAEQVPPRDDIEARLLVIWQEILGVRQIGVTDRFNDVGGHSLAAVKVLARVARDFGRKFQLVTIMQRDTIEQLASLLRDADHVEAWKCVVPIVTRAQGQPIICIHAGMGNVNVYQRLAEEIGDAFPVYGVLALGNWGTQRVQATIEEMAMFYLEQILATQPRGPYVLFGLSMGGPIAMEVARLMRARGLEVRMTAMYDSRAPGYPRYVWSARIRRFVMSHGGIEAWKLRRIFDHRPATSASIGSYAREVRARASATWRAWRAYTRMEQLSRAFVHRDPPPDFPLEASLTRFWLARWRIWARYTPRAYDGRVILFRAMIQNAGAIEDLTNGWGPLVRELQVYDVPGTHSAGLRRPQVATFARLFRECVERECQPGGQERGHTDDVAGGATSVGA